MNRDPQQKWPTLLTPKFATDTAVWAATILLLLTINWLVEWLMAKWEHVATTIFILDRGQVLALPLLGINIVFCIWLTNCVSKIEKSGVGWSDCTNIDVRDARRCILYMVLVAGVLLLTSDKSLVAVVGLALIVLVLGLRAGFHFYQFRTQRTIGSIIFVLTSMLFIETITWAFWSR